MEDGDTDMAFYLSSYHNTFQRFESLHVNLAAIFKNIITHIDTCAANGICGLTIY